MDALWERLTAEGGEEGRCGWLTDRFGVSWQIVPAALARSAPAGIDVGQVHVMASEDAAAVERVTAAFMKMNKLDIAGMEKAFRNE